MPDPPRYHSNASRRPRVAPGELPCAIGVTAELDDSEPIGLAFGVGWIQPDGQEGGGPLESVWRLVVRGEAIEGRFALRGGVFVELAEEA
jgi:hypothetical protein